MNPLRMAGLTCLAAALVLLVLGLALSALKPAWQTISLGRLWNMADPGSLAAIDGALGTGFAAMLWNNVLLPFISLPLWLALALVSVILIALGRPRAG